MPTTNMPLKFYKCQLVNVHISENYISLYTSYNLMAFNSVTTSTSIYIFDNINIWPKTNMPYVCPTALITVYMQTPKSIHLQFIKKLEAFYHAINIHVPITNMPPDPTYANYCICRYLTTMSVYALI